MASATVTVNVAVPMLLAASFAEQVTVVTPTGNVVPEGGAQVTVARPLSASVAVGF